MKARFPYLKAAEVVGLAAMIGILGTIVKLLLQLILNNVAASPSLAMMVSEPDPKNPMHMLLGVLNPFDFWELAVIGVGLARLAGVSFVRAAIPVFAFWFIVMAVIISISTALVRLSG